MDSRNLYWSRTWFAVLKTDSPNIYSPHTRIVADKTDSPNMHRPNYKLNGTQNWLSVRQWRGLKTWSFCSQQPWYTLPHLPEVLTLEATTIWMSLYYRHTAEVTTASTLDRFTCQRWADKDLGNILLQKCDNKLAPLRSQMSRYCSHFTKA